MNTKEYLNKVSKLDKMINNKMIEIMQYRELAERLGSVRYDVKVRTTPNTDIIGSMIVKIDEMEVQLEKMVGRFMDKKTYIIAQIESIGDELLYQVLFARYIERKTFEKIADELNYSQRQISRLHEKALAEFEKRYGAEYLKTE